MKSLFASVALLTLLGAPAAGQMGMMGSGQMMWGMSMARHHLVMMYGLDPRYAGKVNRLPDNRTLEAGERLFEQNCARCHGITGVGDGPDGLQLSPRPANIAAVAKMPMASDAYLFWAISEGGVPVGSAMPPFKDTLKEDDIWKIVSYLRRL